MSFNDKLSDYDIVLSKLFAVTPHFCNAITRRCSGSIARATNKDPFYYIKNLGGAVVLCLQVDIKWGK
jgi:hypothetical protein